MSVCRDKNKVLDTPGARVTGSCEPSGGWSRSWDLRWVLGVGVGAGGWAGSWGMGWKLGDGLGAGGLAGIWVTRWVRYKYPC